MALRIRLETYSFRFAEQVLNSRLETKRELESILLDTSLNLCDLSRPTFNSTLERLFVAQGWQTQPLVFNEPGDPSARMDFLKNRVGVEVGFGHSSYFGIDLLKFQVASYSGIDTIDLGVYITTTRTFQKRQKSEFGQNWTSSLTFEKVRRYLPYFKSAIQVPVFVIGIDC